MGLVLVLVPQHFHSGCDICSQKRVVVVEDFRDTDVITPSPLTLQNCH